MKFLERVLTRAMTWHSALEIVLLDKYRECNSTLLMVLDTTHVYKYKQSEGLYKAQIKIFDFLADIFVDLLICLKPMFKLRK